MLGEFEIRPDWTANCGVTCPRASEKIPKTNNGEKVVSTLAPSFLMGSSLFSQVRRSTITARKSSNFGQVPQLTAELGALEHMEITKCSKFGQIQPRTL